jgi:hypothetical protein
MTPPTVLVGTPHVQEGPYDSQQDTLICGYSILKSHGVEIVWHLLLFFAYA